MKISAHLVFLMVCHRFPKVQIFVFSRSGRELDFAREFGAVWAGATEEEPPEKLHSIIDNTPACKPVVHAPKCLALVGIYLAVPGGISGGWVAVGAAFAICSAFLYSLRNILYRKHLSRYPLTH